MAKRRVNEEGCTSQRSDGLWVSFKVNKTSMYRILHGHYDMPKAKDVRFRKDIPDLFFMDWVSKSNLYSASIFTDSNAMEIRLYVYVIYGYTTTSERNYIPDKEIKLEGRELSQRGILEVIHCVQDTQNEALTVDDSGSTVTTMLRMCG